MGLEPHDFSTACCVLTWYGSVKTDFAFAEFEDARDAEDALQELHRRRFGDKMLVVQHASLRGREDPYNSYSL